MTKNSYETLIARNKKAAFYSFQNKPRISINTLASQSLSNLHQNFWTISADRKLIWKLLIIGIWNICRFSNSKAEIRLCGISHDVFYPCFKCVCSAISDFACVFVCPIWRAYKKARIRFGSRFVITKDSNNVYLEALTNNITTDAVLLVKLHLFCIFWLLDWTNFYMKL